jgi:predicted phosphodiesterase
VYGNHDLPQHNIELANKSGIHTLVTGGHIRLLKNGHFGETQPMVVDEGFYRKIAVWHTFTYMGKEPWPGCTSPTGNKLLRKYPDFDLIVTGDNHQSFYTEMDGRLLVNPGSLTRQDADQIDFKPSVYLWFAEDNTVERVYLPIDKEAVSRQHLDKVEQRNERLEAFISKLDGEWEAGISFEENLERFKEKNKVNSKVMQIIYTALES